MVGNTSTWMMSEYFSGLQGCARERDVVKLHLIGLGESDDPYSESNSSRFADDMTLWPGSTLQWLHLAPSAPRTIHANSTCGSQLPIVLPSNAPTVGVHNRIAGAEGCAPSCIRRGYALPTQLPQRLARALTCDVLFKTESKWNERKKEKRKGNGNGTEQEGTKTFNFPWCLLYIRVC